MLWVDKKYLRLISSRFRNAKWKDDNLLNHSCPYCGDSKKNQHKARGYHFVYKDSFVYKCHNCGESKGFVNFLKEQDSQLYKQYCMEKFDKKSKRKYEPLKRETSKTIRTQKEDLLKKVGCIKAIDSQQARDYLNIRNIPKDKWDDLFYIEHSQSLASLDYKYKDRVFGTDPRLVFPFYSRQGQLVGISGRALNNNELRYLTLKIDETLPLIYGLRKVDFNNTVYVTEGPIDSLFLPNSIAVAGSDFTKLKNIVPASQAVVVFDNEPRNPEIVKKMGQMIDDGFTICMWPKSIVEKDINDMVLSGLSSNVLLQMIDKNKVSGLEARMTLSDWSKVSGS